MCSRHQIKWSHITSHHITPPHPCFSEHRPQPNGSGVSAWVRKTHIKNRRNALDQIFTVNVIIGLFYYYLHCYSPRSTLSLSSCMAWHASLLLTAGKMSREAWMAGHNDVHLLSQDPEKQDPCQHCRLLMSRRVGTDSWAVVIPCNRLLGAPVHIFPYLLLMYISGE